MKQIRILMLLAALIIARDAFGNSERVVDLKSANGTILKGTYFAAAKPGPGVLLFHQSNRDRKSWDDAAGQLVAAGINALTADSRGHGESGGSGKYDEQLWALDLDV